MFHMVCIISKVIFLSVIVFSHEFSRSLEEFHFIHLMVVSPKYVPQQKTWRVCSTIMLVEDLLYLTSKRCFDHVTNHEMLKVALIRKKIPSFKILVFEDFIVRSTDLIAFVILQKTGIELVVTEPLRSGGKEGSKFKDPYDIDDLQKPRVLLTYANNPRFTHCFCLGWGSHSQKYSSLDQLNLKFESSVVQTTKHIDGGQTIVVERLEDYPVVEDLGSPLICEIRRDEVVEASAVVGIYIGGNGKYSSGSLSAYQSFVGTLEPLTRWAIGTNVSVSGNLHEWTLWPERPYPEGEDGGDVKSKSIQLNSIRLCTYFTMVLLVLCQQ